MADNDDEHPDRILRLDEVVAITGLSPATIWREIKTGRFPAPLMISKRCRGWRASEVRTWMASRDRVQPS